MSGVVSNDAFKGFMSNFASSVTVVTTVDANGSPWGLTVSAFTSTKFACAHTAVAPSACTCGDSVGAERGRLR